MSIINKGEHEIESIYRHIPKLSTEIKDPESDAVAYLYNNIGGQPCAIGYIGERHNPDYNYAFHSASARDAHVAKHFESRRRHLQAKHEMKMARAATKNTLQVGDILSYSWGYDQTNIEFYQVVEVKPKTVNIRRIKATHQTTGFMCGATMPLKDQFIGNAMTKRVARGGDSVNMDFGQARKWNSLPEHESWYA